MMNKIRKKKLTAATALMLILLACAVCCVLFSAFTELRLEFAAAAAVLCAASAAVLILVYRYINRENDFFTEREKIISAAAYIRFDRKSRSAVLSDNFERLTGISAGSGIISEERYEAVMSELKANAVFPDEDIYMSAVPERYIQISGFTTERFVYVSVTDVSKYAVCKNVVKSLKYYDAETGVLSREAFTAKVREASRANSEADTVGIINIVISGIDKVMSFAGAAAADGIIAKAASYIKKYDNPHNIFTGRTSTAEFSVLITETYDDGCKKLAEKICAGLSETLSSVSGNETANVRVFCGYACFHGNGNDAASMISSANFASFDAEKRGSTASVEFSSAAFEAKAQEFKKVQIFNSLIAGNKIDYHFQPIINAHTGEVFAYEALMRPRAEDGVKLSPPEMLDIAEQQEMLYEIERITFNSALKHLSENQEIFSSRKMFINCIPSKVLSEDDYTRLMDSYGTIFNKVVVEITEGTPILSDVTELINSRYRSHRAQVALDDYGTGYSNESTLLSVKPDYIKIDRSIISDIDKDPQKLHLASNMVDFCAQHGIKVLAEGVETVEELETVISLHVDLIQGYYTGKASAVFILDMPEDIRNQIISFNLKYNGNVSKTYEITDKTPVNIVELALAGYTDISVKCECANIEGDPDIPVKMNISADGDANMRIRMNNVNIECGEAPAFSVGRDGKVNLKLSGKNTITGGGIRVPSGAELYICGGGELCISADKVSVYGIGGNNIQSYGKIKIAFDGRISIIENGDYIVGIGGGMGEEDSSIDVISGIVELKLNGRDIVGIGSYVNETAININPARLELALAGQNVVAVGSKSGHAEIVCSADIKANVSGDSCCCIGTLERGSGKIAINGGTADITVRGKRIAGIGAVKGNTEIVLNAGVQNILCEGDNATCIGDNFGSGSIKCQGSAIKAIAKAAKENPVGMNDGRVYVTGGSIFTSDPEPPEFYSPDGEKLVRVSKDGRKEFVQTIKCRNGSYVFTAKPIGEDYMYVYLPGEMSFAEE